uniref:PaREP6 n=1 Tax=Thermofilum pendens TaxID=2269 RepID=A0A7J3X6U2_THEPE
MGADEILEWEEEARRLRREKADWEFIEKLPPKLKAALKYYIEAGDMRVAQQIAGIDFEDLRELIRRARIPVVL